MQDDQDVAAYGWVRGTALTGGVSYNDKCRRAAVLLRPTR